MISLLALPFGIFPQSIGLFGVMDWMTGGTERFFRVLFSFCFVSSLVTRELEAGVRALAVATLYEERRGRERGTECEGRARKIQVIYTNRAARPCAACCERLLANTCLLCLPAYPRNNEYFTFEMVGSWGKDCGKGRLNTAGSHTLNCRCLVAAGA